MNVTRRVVAGALAASSFSRILGANDRVRMGFIGYGLIGAQHVHDFKNQKDADLVALAEVHQPRMEQGVAACGGSAEGYRDFRKLLDRKDIDAVCVSTPDHWHALMAMMACAAGKDVYVEKPMTLFPAEGQWMVKVARRHQRVVQVGTQQRSGLHYQQARELLRGGRIGPIVAARSGSFRNVMPGFGAPPDGSAPSFFDYDQWLGPAPLRPYNPQRGIYHFRWFWDYSGGQMTNLAAHDLDIVQWVLGVKGPLGVYSTGGRFAMEDNGETPDTQDALIEYPKCTAAWSHREASQGSVAQRGLAFYGTKGSLVITRGGFEIVSDDKIDPKNRIPVFKGHPGGGPQRSETKPEPWTEPMKVPGNSDQQFDSHVRNFLDCVKSRQRCVADVEDGHATALTCHLANMSLRLKRRLAWDAAREEVVNDREATAMLTRPYRKPWDGVLRSLLA